MPDAISRLNTSLADRYRIERELGAGGMATVYLAEDLKHDRKVAVKVLKPELTAVLGGDRFIQEIKTTASLQHPHILPLFDSGTAGGFLFYVMPYSEAQAPPPGRACCSAYAGPHLGRRSSAESVSGADVGGGRGRPRRLAGAAPDRRDHQPAVKIEVMTLGSSGRIFRACPVPSNA